MDISKRWTIDERMRLPDWCFGSREVAGVSRTAVGVGVTAWAISALALPKEACIWEVGIIPRAIDSTNSYVRFGLNDTLPTNTGEMDLSIPILPNFGTSPPQPPKIYLATGVEVWKFAPRKGLDTKGKKLTIELNCFTGPKVAMFVYVVFSGLPTNISGWLANQFLTEVR